jgi:hypothetical protein
MPGKIWLDTLEKMMAARVLLPRSMGNGKPGTAHPSFKVFASPPDAVRFKCEQAGIPLKLGPHPKGQRHLTIYEGHWADDGLQLLPDACRRTRSTARGRVRSGISGGVGKFRTDSDILVFAVPPVKVTHDSRTWTMAVDFHLCVY